MILSILSVSAILGVSVIGSQSSYAQTSNESDTIQCVTTPCELATTTQPLPAEQNTTNTIVMPKDETQLSSELQNNNDGQTEPCISPCPPGEVCIQMCQPTGLQNTPPPPVT